MAESFNGGVKSTIFPIDKKIKEDQATSILFAVLELVFPFRDALFETIGQRPYKSGKDFDCILRPSIGGKQTDKDIPDALIELEQKEHWRSLVEVKIGSTDLDQAQLVRYLNRAIEQKIDSLITISNEMCVTPDQPPLRLKPADKRLRKIRHFHWSWRFIEYVAKRTLSHSELSEIESAILRQFVDLLSNEVGIHGFKSMPAIWPKFVDTMRDGGHPTEEDSDQIISAWFQETSDISLILSEIYDGDVRYISDAKTIELRKDAAEKLLRDKGDLEAKFRVSKSHELKITLDVNSRFIRYETNHLPTDKVKTSHKQIERFLDIFRENSITGDWGDHSDVRLFGTWKRQQRRTDTSMTDALVNLEEDALKGSAFIIPDKELSGIIVQYTPADAQSHFRSAKKLIEFLENHTKFFVETYVNI